ncbi:phage tail tape measure protein [Siccibacter colletis]|uniref:phage tail tape measure protein n=1 Tax=Siccibacter colletis TaxID=1505757 RepID=UPI0004E127FA|nr:phage tail tape measure protein [Siccibacter colletis]
MTDQIASITLRADVSDLKTASNELDKLGQAAAGAVEKADDLNSVFRAGAESAKQGSEGLKEQQTALKGLLENIDPVNKALNRLDEQQAALRNFQTKGFLDTDDFQHYNKILDETRLKLTDTGEAAARAQAELAATQAAEKQSAALKNLLGSIDPTIRAFNSLDEQHAQLVAHLEAGRINGAQFEHYNAILNQTRERLSSVADVLPEALSRQEAAARRAGISVGQYSAAMRTLPAQFTDIATQLAGGQSPFLILLQQGGQIKDQFGGVKGAISGVTSYITGLLGLLNPVTIGLAAVAGGFAYVAYQAYENNKQVSALNQALAKTGNISGKSAEGLQSLSRQLASARDVSKSAAVDVVTKATAMGASADQIAQFSNTALLMSKTTGQSVDELLKQFERIGKDPVQALIGLNEQYHFATLALYEQVKALTDAGDTAGATKAIIDQLANSQKSFGDASVSSLRLTGGWWDDLIDKVGKYKLSLDDLKATPTVGLKEQGIRTGGSELPGWDYVTREAAKPQIPTVEVTKAGLQQLISLQQENSAKAKQFNDEQLKFRLQMNASEKSLATNAQKRTEEAEKYAKAVKAGYITQMEADRHLAQFNERYKDPKTPKTPSVKVDDGERTVETYQAQARTLTETLETLRKTGETQAKNTELSKQQSRFAELDQAAKTRALTTQENALLASREAILNAAKVVDHKNKEIEAQQKINGLAQQANKYVTQMSEKADALRGSAGLSGRQAQRMREEAQLRQGWINSGGKLDDAGYEKELKALKNYYSEEDRLRSDWKAGAKNGWNEYLEVATNTYSAVNNVASSALNGLSGMLTDLMITGKASIKSFGMSMLKMIAEVVNRLLVAHAVQAAMGWISGGSGSSGGSTPGGAYTNAAAGVTFNAKGGVYDSPGLSKYVNGVYDSPQYFTFQGASKFAKGGVFAEAGAEAIMPLTRDSAGRLGVRAQGGGGVAPVINTTVNVDAGGSATAHTSSSGDAMGRALADEMQNAALQVVQRHLKPGGMIYNFTKGR